jgi:hypothetical protein
LLPEQLGMLIDGTGEALLGSDTWFRLGDAHWLKGSLVLDGWVRVT